MSANPSPSVKQNDTVPSGKVNLRFLLVSGKRTDLLCDPTDNIEHVRKQAHQQWPSGMKLFFDIS
jgi:hypothetical protein